MTRTPEQRAFQSEFEFHCREWRIQRIGWVLVAIFLALALAGLFGGGPLSTAGAGDARAGRIEYEHFTRYGADTTLTVTPAAAGRGEVQVAIDAEYLRAFKIESITPQPVAVHASSNLLVFRFAAAPDASLAFRLQPERIGTHAATVRIGSGRPLVLRQFTYP